MDDFESDIRKAADALGFDFIALPETVAQSRDAAIRFLVDRLASADKLQPGSAEAALQGVLYRESLGSTAIGKSIAMPQACMPSAVKTIAGIVARSPTDISWDTEPVRWIILYITNAGVDVKRLEILGAIVRAARSGGPPRATAL